MNIKTTYMLALLVIVGGLLLLLAQPWKKAAESKSDADESNARLVVEKPPAIGDVDRLEITPAGEPKMVFVRDAERGWRIAEPIDAPALAFPIRTAVSTLVELEYLKSYGKNDKSRPSDADAGTGDGALVASIHDADSNQTLTFRLGHNAPLSTNTYVKVDGDDTLYEVGGQVAEPFDKSHNDFRDKNLLSDLLQDRIARIRIEGLQSYELARTGDGWLIEQPIRARADKRKADAMAVAARGLNAKKFVDDNPTSLARYGLESPSLRVTVTAEPKTAPAGDAATDTQPAKAPIVRTILIGGLAGEDYFAKLADQPWVFTIAQTSRTPLAVPMNDMRDTQLLEFAKPDVTAVEITRDGETSKLTREEGVWKLPDGADADAAAVEDLLNEARSLKATRFVDDTGLADPGLDPPAAVVQFVVSGEASPRSLEIGGKTASGAMVYVRNPATETIALVREDEVANLRRPSLAYRSRDMLSFNQAFANRLEIQRDGETWVLEKHDTAWKVAEPIAADADADAVTAILSDLSSLRARSVAGVGNADEFGLAEPAVVATVRYQPLPMPADMANEDEAATTEPADDADDDATTQPADDGASKENEGVKWVDQDPVTHVVRFAQHDGTVYASVDETGIVYEVDHAIFDDMNAVLIDRHIAPVESSQIVGVVFESSKGRTQINRIGDTWTYADDPSLPIDAKNINRIISGITNLKTDKVVDTSPGDLATYGLDEPPVRVTLTLDDHSTVEIDVSADGPEDRNAKYATTSSLGRVYLLTVDQLGVLTKSADDITAAPKKPAQRPPATPMPMPTQR